MALTPSNPMTPEEKRAQRDAAQEDVLLREVDEAVRQGDFEDFARTWGKPLLGGLILILALFGGYLVWQSRQEAAMEKDSEALVSALDQLEAGNLQSADERLAALAGEADGAAAANARILRGGIAAQQGRAAEAAKIFAEVAADEDAPQLLRDLARLREITTRFDSMEPVEAVAALKPLAVPGKPYFASAGELLGHAYLDMGKRAEAGAVFAQIAKDKDAPDPLRSRARQMAGILGVDAIEDVDTLLEEQGVARDSANGDGAAAPVQ